MITDQWDRIAVELAKREMPASLLSDYRKMFYAGAAYVLRRLMTEAIEGDPTKVADSLVALSRELGTLRQPGEFEK